MLTNSYSDSNLIETINEVQNGRASYQQIYKHPNLDTKCKVISTVCHHEAKTIAANNTKIINLERLNDVRFLNKFLAAINSKLQTNGEFIGRFEEYQARKMRLLFSRPKPVTYLIHPSDFLIHRVVPKISLTKKIYFEITKGKGRVLTKAEAFGRLYSCGFEISEEQTLGGETYFVAQKIKEPTLDQHPSYGPIIKLNRVGKNGRTIKVYKLRTMHPFSEYLQDYVFQKNQLEKGGKFKNDFRISTEGKMFRKFWIDELPMLINLLKGEMKLIGVRPLSKQYFSLYTPELQEKRTKTKPGLLPPFYADMPETLEEIIASELKYLNSYEKAPLATDMKYFLSSIKNIIWKGARSQ